MSEFIGELYYIEIHIHLCFNLYYVTILTLNIHFTNYVYMLLYEKDFIEDLVEESSN